MSGGGVLDALLVDGGVVAERESEGVVVDQGERQGGLLLGSRIEQPGDAGVAFQFTTLANPPQFSRKILLVFNFICKLKAGTEDQPQAAVSCPGSPRDPAMYLTGSVPAPRREATP